MVLLQTPEAELGKSAIDFKLRGTDNRDWSLADVRGDHGTLIAFICNHCPYVKAVIERLAQQCAQLTENGVGIAMICSNDANYEPEDSFEKMRDFARKHEFGFPYLHDESQQIAKAYGAVCTPDFFGYDADLKLVYRGRLDDCALDPPQKSTKPELLHAMLEVAQAKPISFTQYPSMGCSIKWK